MSEKNNSIHMHDSGLVVDFLQNLPPEIIFESDDENEMKDVEKSEIVNDEKEKKRKEQEESTIQYKSLLKDQEELKKRQREKKSEEMLEKMTNELLEERNTLLPEIQKVINIHKEFHSKQREEMYTQWKKDEFDPIQKSIKKKLKQLNPLDIQKRRTEMFSKYLEASNKKGGVFRDIIIETDYDPMENHLHTLKYEVPLSGLKKRQLNTGPAKTRKMFDTTKWGENVVESTPVGRYSIQNKYNPLNFKKSKVSLKNSKSSLAFDHYHYDRGNKKVKFGKRIDKTKNKPKNTKDLITGYEHGASRGNRRKTKRIVKGIKK